MKNIREGYKITELGEIPESWNINKIGELTDIKTGGTPSTKCEEYWINGNIPWMVSGDVNKKIVNEVEGRITNSGMENSAAKLLPKDTVMIALNGQGKTKGTVAYLNIELTCNQSLAGFLPNNDVFNSKYLYYNLQSRYSEIRGLAGDGARNGLNLGLLRDILIPLPTIEEQEKIASILSTVDEQIDNVDGLIQKNKELKKGLMQQLLTKGIGHTKFKNTEIGEIPEEWEVNSNFIIIKSGFGFKLKEYVYDGVPLIRINNVMYGRIIDDDLSYLPEEYVKSYKDFVLKKGDILLALNRPITNNRLKIGIVNKEPAILYQRVGKLEFKTKKYLGEFFYQYMQSDKFIKVLENTLVGSDQPYIKTSEFEKLKFPVPSIEEQQKIVSILSEVDKKIEGYENKKYKLEELKKGLMQQLLTGRTRVI